MNDELNDNFEEREKQKLAKKEDQQISNSSKPFYNFLVELFNLPLQKQILVFFFMIYIIYLLFIIIMKLSKLDNLNMEIADMTYYSAVAKEYFNNIDESYQNIHSMGFNSNMTHLTKGVNFLNIYSRELNRINLTFYDSNQKNGFLYNWESLNNLQSLYNDSDFQTSRFSYSIKGNFTNNLFSKYDPLVTKEKERSIYVGYNNELLFPMLFVLVPNIIDSASQHRLRLETVNFISSTFERNPNSLKFECYRNSKADYFSYPKYNPGHENFIFMDEVIDPHSSCEIMDLAGNYTIDNNLNYYYVAEKNFTSMNSNHRKILNNFQRLEDDQKRTNFFSYLSLQKFKRSSTTTGILSFVFNFYDNLVNYNEHNDKFNHFSIFYPNNNLIENESNTFPNNDKPDPSLTYNIINQRRLVITIPPFLENLYIYGYNATKYFKEYYDDENSIVNTNDIFAYGNNTKILNSNFYSDARVFNLIAFLAKQFREIHSGIENTCNNYNYILSEFGYDKEDHTCFPDLCKFNSCIGTEFFFEPREYLQGSLDCRCLPLFCGNYLSDKINKSINIIENSPVNNNPNINKEQWDNYDLYKKLNETVFYNSFSLDFFNKRNKQTNLRCKINFTKKTYIEPDKIQDIEPDSHFILDLKISDKPFTTDGIFIVSYLVNKNNVVFNLYNLFFKEIKELNFKIFISYSIMIVLFSFVCLRKFFNNLNNFKDRIIELNENKILRIINKQNEKKNMAKIKKILNNFTQENQENEDNLPSESANLTNVNSEENEKPEIEDELEDIKILIISNINKFCISFTNKVVFHEKNEIFVKYINKIKKEVMIKVNFDNNGYSKKIINDYFSKNFLDYFLIEKISNEKSLDKEIYIKEFKERRKIIKEYEKDKNVIYRDYSCLMLIELISTEIDMKNIFPNFYYKDPLCNKSKFDLYDLIDKYLEDDYQNICESSDLNKMENFISFYNESVVFKWNMELQKRIFNDYYFYDNDQE